MDQGQAAVWAAAIGVPGVLLSGVLSYRAGRRQVRDQGANEHMQWLRQQRQQCYVQFLQAVDACMKALEAHSVAIVGLSDRLEAGDLDAATYDFDPLLFPAAVLSRIDELSKSRDGLLMLGPHEVDDQAEATFSAIVAYWAAHGDAVVAMMSGQQADGHPAWNALATTEDAAIAERKEFIAASRSVLTEPPK